MADAEKLLESTFGPGMENVSIQASQAPDGTQIFYANAGVSTSGILIKTVTAEAGVSLIHMLQSKGHQVQQVDAHILNATVSASAGFTYVGVNASLNLVKIDASIFSATLGLGVDTAAGVEDESLTVKVLGTGVTVGRKVGVSVLGNKFEIDTQSPVRSGISLPISNSTSCALQAQ